MNKQEAIEKIEKLNGLTIKEKNLILDIEMISKGDVLEIIEQIDEPEKPVLPQYVADYIEENKDALKEYVFTNVQVVLPIIPTENPMYKWLNGKGIGIIVDCIREGYEVEKEELYTVRFKFLEDNGYNYLVKLTDTDRFSIGGLVCDVKDAGHRQAFFTKEELSERGLWGNPLIVIKNINGEVQE